ncbi:hypothetical protein Ocepr_2329 (plasmid) [Oceanithermus profundus DSM 14977]|uniref:Uncharacterized protein n=1 Tax=Oceanithermus profundus (strain DSM 14977 / NBRC 100410 / VKM B-2274 / 506) TaxID=670487 RepID=E4UAJ8_OCEP5|nr:hypothetical protein [Oceanithermus profundus]ADR37777.1 hypothetical protein Ocepr_2329 [Oceanithermus profundus DSM 14977]
MNKSTEVGVNLDQGVLVRRYTSDGHAVAFIRDGNVVRPVFDTKANKFYPRALLSAVVPDLQPATPEQMAELKRLGWPWNEPLSQKEAGLALTVWSDFVIHRNPKDAGQAAVQAQVA